MRGLEGNPLLLKEVVKSQVEGKVGHEGRMRAASDWHARRKPIGCGLTIHPGIGCPFQCAYCYIYDMGFEAYATPYSLSGDQLTLALLYNRYFVPGPWGTYLAFGSVTEPLLPNIAGKTLEYMKSVALNLGNPCQVATKIPASDDLLDRIKSIRGLRLSILVTITSLRKYRALEEKASEPMERFEFIRRARRKGFKPFLFWRPFLPGLPLEEIEEMVCEAKRSGAYGVVVGGLRLSHNIVKRLVGRGMDLRLLKSIVDLDRLKKGFVDVKIGDKEVEEVRSLVTAKGMIFLRRACCANTASQVLEGFEDAICPSLCFLSKRACDPSCPSKCYNKALRYPHHVDVESVVSYVLRTKSFHIEQQGVTLVVETSKRTCDVKWASSVLTQVLRRKVVFKLH